MISVTIKFFAYARDVVGRPVLVQAFEQEPCTVADVLAWLAGSYPALAAHADRLLVARNLKYVSREAVVADGDELVILPPVGGG